MAALAPGQRLADGRYEIVDKLGEGGMGEVYRARQVAVGREVALKLIAPDVVRSPETAARFQREMKLSAKIEHPNTIRVYDFGVYDGHLYLAMELVRGTTLRAELERAGRLPLERIVRIGTQIARALAAAHGEGIVHRDLKPDNVMLVEQYGEQDVVKVLDFGIAKSLNNDDDTHVTRTGAILGTPAYMAPEQAMGQHVDARCDLYALGIMLFEMSAGRVPFEASSITALLVAHATEQPPLLSELVPGLHPGLVQLVERLLKKTPAERPASAEAVEAALRALSATRVTTRAAERDTNAEAMQTPPTSSEKPVSTQTLLWAILISALGLSVAGLLLWAQDGAPDPRAQPDAPPLPALNAGPRAAAFWEVAALQNGVDTRLDAVGLPRPPEVCGSEKGLAAGLYLVSAQAALADDPAQAATAARQAIEACESWAAAHNILGNALSAMGQFERAADAYNRALREAPGYDAPRFNLGVLQLRQKDKQAIATFTQLIAQKPSYPDVYKSRAQAYLFEKRYNEGLSDLEKSLELQPNDGEVWLMAAQLREQLNKQGAKDAYCRARALGVEAANAHCPEP